MRKTASLLVFSLILMNTAVLYEVMQYIYLDTQTEDYQKQNAPFKAERNISLEDIVRTSRKSDNNIINMFVDTHISSDVADANKNSMASDDIIKARLVGIIAPLEKNFYKTAIVEYGAPLRTLRLHQGDIIPGTNWKIKLIADREILIENNAIELKLSFR
ncbi:hypothetical protein LRS73_08390 [Methylobacterium currus]|uniref:hypothetical protein n=1 Tax=Methylobacterium currus TaxID=2051553 RepID=UPI001E4D00F3|nr:hypothetical protein [Methylobacterium currus]UHC17861.1 hypothetical protein LRS73_08390 [Methylobacterium currus]